MLSQDRLGSTPPDPQSVLPVQACWTTDASTQLQLAWGTDAAPSSRCRSSSARAQAVATCWTEEDGDVTILHCPTPEQPSAAATGARQAAGLHGNMAQRGTCSLSHCTSPLHLSSVLLPAGPPNAPLVPASRTSHKPCSPCPGWTPELRHCASEPLAAHNPAPTCTASSPLPGPEPAPGSPQACAPEAALDIPLECPPTCPPCLSPSCAPPLRSPALAPAVLSSTQLRAPRRCPLAQPLRPEQCPTPLSRPSRLQQNLLGRSQSLQCLPALLPTALGSAARGCHSQGLPKPWLRPWQVQEQECKLQRGWSTEELGQSLALQPHASPSTLYCSGSTSLLEDQGCSGVSPSARAHGQHR